MLKTASLWALLMLSIHVVADDLKVQQAAFDALVEANHFKMTLNGEKVAGPGLDWLVHEGAKAQYFLIGERHGLAEIPKISGAVFTKLATHGYEHAALEFGPFAAMKLESLLKQGGYSALEQFLTSDTGHNAIAFLGWQEEAAMAAVMYAASQNPSDFFWGLDQEFLLGFKSFLEYLEQHAKTKEQREAIIQVRDNLKSDDYYFANMLPQQMWAFTDKFRDIKSADVQQLLDDMIFSNRVYGPWAKPSRLYKAQSNIEREEGMKRKFVQWVERIRKTTGKDPKVFFKFGGFHSAPSIDLRNGRITLGTFVEAFAKANHKSAFNLFMECSSGVRKSSGQDADGAVDKSRGCKSAMGKIDVKIDISKQRHPFSRFVDGRDDIFLVDLRPIRLQMDKFHFLSDGARKLISSFDAYMAIPNTTPAKSFERRD